MSWRIANECAERRLAVPARKQIIMFLPTKRAMTARASGVRRARSSATRSLGESTVKRTINDFLREGILIETGQRRCQNGYTVIYRIVLAKIAQLETTAEPDVETGFTVDPVQSEPGTGSMVDGVRGPRWTPNHPKTIHKPPTRETRARRRRRLKI